MEPSVVVALGALIVAVISLMWTGAISGRQTTIAQRAKSTFMRRQTAAGTARAVKIPRAPAPSAPG